LTIIYRKSNECIEKYPLHTEFKRKPIFSIDYDSNSKSNYIYCTNELGFFNDSVYTAKFSLYLHDNKFFAKLKSPESNDFILFDLNSKLNKTNKIDIQNSKKIKSFECILEKQIITKQNLEVKVFRIKKWGRLPSFFGGSELDAVVFVTKKYGVIGSYFSDIYSCENEIMLGPSGEILKEYIDYSKTREGELL